MGRLSLIDRWRTGIVHGLRDGEVVAELERLGFDVERGGSHAKATHPKLVDCPSFPLDLLTLNFHASGKQGGVHPGTLRDIVKAVKWIERDDS